METNELVECVVADDLGNIIALTAIIFMDFPPTFPNISGKMSLMMSLMRMS